MSLGSESLGSAFHAPSHRFWALLGAGTVALLVVGVVVFSPLVGLVLGSLYVLVALSLWAVGRLLTFLGLSVDSRPVTVAGVVSAFALIYSVVVEGALLLGLLASLFALGASVALGAVLALD